MATQPVADRNEVAVWLPTFYSPSDNLYNATDRFKIHGLPHAVAALREATQVYCLILEVRPSSSIWAALDTSLIRTRGKGEFPQHARVNGDNAQLRALAAPLDPVSSQNQIAQADPPITDFSMRQVLEMFYGVSKSFFDGRMQYRVGVVTCKEQPGAASLWKAQMWDTQPIGTVSSDVWIFRRFSGTNNTAELRAFVASNATAPVNLNNLIVPPKITPYVQGRPAWPSLPEVPPSNAMFVPAERHDSFLIANPYRDLTIDQMLDGRVDIDILTEGEVILWLALHLTNAELDHRLNDVRRYQRRGKQLMSNNTTKWITKALKARQDGSDYQRDREEFDKAREANKLTQPRSIEYNRHRLRWQNKFELERAAKRREQDSERAAMKAEQSNKQTAQDMNASPQTSTKVQSGQRVPLYPPGTGTPFPGTTQHIRPSSHSNPAPRSGSNHSFAEPPSHGGGSLRNPTPGRSEVGQQGNSREQRSGQVNPMYLPPPAHGYRLLRPQEPATPTPAARYGLGHPGSGTQRTLSAQLETIRLPSPGGTRPGRDKTPRPLLPRPRRREPEEEGDNM